MVGVFCALDVFLFYIFWEVSLVPMYFLIGIWGHEQRQYAAIKFFLYTLLGSLAMLLAMLGLYFHFHTFDFQEMIRLGADGQWVIPAESVKGALIFWGLFVGFAIKVPLFPFHTWLPLAHVEAPTAGSVILAGVLLKMGTYGFVRFSLPILPLQCRRFAYIVAVLALISIIYGALCAMAQRDMKRLVAYSSVNHMGYVMLGVAAAMAGRAVMLGDKLISVEATALNGAVLQMVSHGIITGALFLLVGVIYDRAHTRDLDAFGGLWTRVPIYGGVLILASLASLGLPGLAGFVAEFPIFIGAFGVGGPYRLFACLGVMGIVITAGFFLWMIQRVLLGPLNEKWADLRDMDMREKLSLYPLAALMIIIGIMPMWLLRPINNAMTELLTRIHVHLLP
jgi:NADH-quinone oxidoreductase subunit M